MTGDQAPVPPVAVLDGPGAPEHRTNGHRPPRRTTAPDAGTFVSPAARLEAARAAYRASVAAGAPLSGAELGRRFDMSPQWGRGVVAAVRAEDAPPAPAPPGAASDAPRADMAPERIDMSSARTAMLPTDIDMAPEHIDMAPPVDRQAVRHWADTLIVLVVALVAAAASYGHMEHVALLAGEPLWLARAFPITVDGLAVAALRRGEDGRRWLALALVVSVAGNVLAQYPEAAAAAGPVVSAWPPLALYGTHRLLHGRSAPE